MRAFDGVRLPLATYDEDHGMPVTVMDAAGHPLATLSAAEWRALHIESKCVHGYHHCHACRYRLPTSQRPVAASKAPIAVSVA